MSGSAERVRQLQAQQEQRRLSKEELLRPRIIERDEFIESLGGTIRIRSLSHRMRTDIRQRAGFGTNEWDEDKFTNLGIIFSIIDPPMTEEDIEKLKDQDSNIYDDLVLRISMLNMLGQQEELGKDSSETQS